MLFALIVYKDCLLYLVSITIQNGGYYCRQFVYQATSSLIETHRLFRRNLLGGTEKGEYLGQGSLWYIDC